MKLVLKLKLKLNTGTKRFHHTHWSLVDGSFKFLRFYTLQSDVSYFINLIASFARSLFHSNTASSNISLLLPAVGKSA